MRSRILGCRSRSSESRNNGTGCARVFYFGNAAGDVGVGNGQSVLTGNFWQVTVTGTDGSAVLANQTAPVAQPLAITLTLVRIREYRGRIEHKFLHPKVQSFDSSMPQRTACDDDGVGDSDSSSLAPVISSPSVMTNALGLSISS